MSETTKKKSTTLKEEVRLWQGPYTGQLEKVYKSKDEYVQDGEYGEHNYVRTQKVDDVYPVFEWRGPVAHEV